MRLPPSAICLVPAALLACGGGPGDGFAASMGPVITSASGSTQASGSTADSSTSGPAGSTSGADGSTSGTASSTSEAASSTPAGSTTTIYDVGSGGDVGPLQPPGCKGKIDFLFMMQRYSKSPGSQEKLIAAFPEFIATIQERFAGFDVHIMVVDSDHGWGLDECDPNGCLAAGNNGCKLKDTLIPDYPCGMHDTVAQDKCNITLGAGVTFNAGINAANVPCKLDDDRRYITQDQSDLVETFACLAKVGSAGTTRVGSTIVRAVSPELNEPGGCNDGFLRDDALLMITLALTAGDVISEDGPTKWAEAVFDAKNGDKSSVIMFAIGGWLDPPEKTGEVGKFVSLFPLHQFTHITEPSYAPHFAAAVELVDEACKVFTPG